MLKLNRIKPADFKPSGITVDELQMSGEALQELKFTDADGKRYTIKHDTFKLEIYEEEAKAA